MGLRALNNPNSSFKDPYSSTGLEATAPAPAGNEVFVSGGTKVVNPDGFTTHTFPFVGYGDVFTLSISSAPPVFEIDYLILGGGGHGAGPGYGCGGGGAGGYITQTHLPVPAGTTAIPITLGRAGQVAAQPGGDSTITFPWMPAPTQAKTAYGGGKGGAWLYPSPVANSGGSGAGGGCGGPPTYGQYNRGGWGNTAPPTNNNFLAANQTAQGTNGGGGTLHGGPTGYVGGGGGGAAGSGAPGNPVDTVPTYSPGRGLLNSISGTATMYCNGGKAGGYSTGASPAPSNNTNALGSGGNGGGGNSTGKMGGDGVCIIRYASLQALGGDSYITATGGDSTIDVGDYRTHLFTSTGPGTFTVNSLASNPEYNIATVCVIAGGGTGGSGNAGGGGGGGVLIDRHYKLTNVTYPISVGAGGAAKPPSGPGNSGADSTFTDPTATYTALKGGAGGHGSGSSGGANGGSGGGGCGDYPSGNGNYGYSTGTNQGGFTQFGSPGGNCKNNYGGGGGGAGGNGMDGPMAYHAFEPSPTKGGMGGNAIYIPEFSHPSFPAGGTHPGYYAGGGGGYGPGGSGPPNRSAYGAVGPGSPYRVNTGDGQWAGSTGTGSPGIVMIRYRFQ